MHRIRTPASISTPASTRRGVAAVEFALILPLLLLIVLGCVDFGRFASRYIAVTNAARAGAGFAIMNPYTTTTEATWAAKLRQAVEDEMPWTAEGKSAFDERFSKTDLQVSHMRTLETGGRWRIRVTASFPFQTIVPWETIFPLLPPWDWDVPATPLPVTRSVEMRGIR